MTERFTVEKFTELEYGIKQDGETLIGLSLDKITAKYIVEQWNGLAEENEELKKRLGLYAEIYPTGRWITELKSEELVKELEE